MGGTVGAAAGGGSSIVVVLAGPVTALSLQITDHSAAAQHNALQSSYLLWRRLPGEEATLG